MKLFIDGEWNSYKGSLISMALVPESGSPFYEVLHCANPHEWVEKNVMPVLNKNPISRLAFTNKLNAYLSKFDEIEVIADWPEDIEHFCREVITGPGERIGPDKMVFVVDRACGNDDSAVLHNALEDAIAIRDSYVKARKES
jgi:hypothetical protein